MSRTRPVRPFPGDVIQGRFRVGPELGKGGMSVVYRAHDQWHGRDVALKVLTLPEDDPVSSLYLEQEFRAMTKLRHPRLVEVYDYGVVQSGMPFFTMELLPGTDLSAVERLALDEVYRVLIAISEALAFMHSRGYVHRDVKAANVRVLSRGHGRPIEVKLMDCGLVSQLGERARGVAGTLTHLAPEVWFGAPADVRADLYALGVLAYEITAGCLPFEAKTGSTLLRLKTESLPDLRAHRPDVPPGFARLVRDLMAADPANRPVHAFEVLARLSQFAAVDFDPVPAFCLRAPPLVGRSRELAELREVLLRASTGKSALCMIMAPAGAGKTRLLEEALLEARLRGGTIATTSGRGFGGAPYQALGELLSPLLRSAGARAELDRIGGPGVLGPLASGSGLVAVPADSDPIGTRRSWYAALNALLDGLAREHPIVLGIDDLHLADAASVDALVNMIGLQTARVALLGTLRTDQPLSAPLRQIVSASRLLELARMTRVEIGELVERTLGPAEVGSALLGDLEHLSGGNVSFVLEVLRSLVSRGLVRPMRTKVCLPDALDAPDLPRSLTEALERRIAALSPPALRVARVTAVASHSLEFELARTLAELESDPFLDAVDELRQRELVEVQAFGLSLRHRRLREVLYQGMGMEQRRSLHRRLAAELERRSEPSERAADLGHHYAEGGVERRALECMVLAGDLRYQRFAYFDAGDAYRRALALLPAAPKRTRLDLERKLNDRLGRIGFYHDHQGAPPYLERARRLHLRHGLLRMIGPLARLVGAGCAVVLVLGLTALHNWVRRRPRPLRGVMEHLLDSFAATAYLCNCYTYTGHQARALDAAEYLRPFVYSKRRLPRVGYLIARAPALLFTHRLHAAAAACEEALTILARDQRTPVAEHDRVHATGGALVVRLWADLGRGFWRSPWWQRVEDYTKTHPTALLETWLIEVRLFAAYRRGDLATARDLWQELLDKAKLSEIFFVQGKGRVWFGMACLEAGHTSEALDLADELIRETRERDNPMLLAMGLLLRGMALHVWEQLADAGRAFEEAARLAEREDVGAHGVYRDVLLAQAALCLDLGQHVRARELVSRVEEASPPVEPPHELHQLRCERILGQAALGERAPADAIRHFSRALELGEHLEDSLERGLSAHSLSLALALAGDDRAAAERRAEAKRILRERGATYQLRRLAYSDRPRRSRPDDGPASPDAASSHPIEPEAVSEVDSTSHLGDTQHRVEVSAGARRVEE